VHVVEVAEVAPGIHRLALPLGIHGVETLSAYLLPDPAGDTLVDCGIAVGPEDEDACAALDEGLRACGSSVERVARLVVTHAHIDHFGLAGEVVRRSGGDLVMHRRTDLDLAKYAEPDEAVDTRELMLADHGLYGPELTASARGLCDWIPRMPRSDGRPCSSTAGRHSRRPTARGRWSTRRGTHPGTSASGRRPTGCSAPVTTCCGWRPRR
jgi:hypothetical protein